MGGLFTDKLDATALLLNARQYGDEHVKYGQTYGLVNACMVGQSVTSVVRISSNFFKASPCSSISERAVVIAVVSQLTWSARLHINSSLLYTQPTKLATVELLIS